MEIKDLLFFNKEGYAINANYNTDLDLWSSKILFDKNSTDTTLGLRFYPSIKIKNPLSYKEQLRENNIIVDPTERQAKIVELAIKK